MMRKQERNIIAFIGTVLFMGFVILLLFLLKLAITQPAEKYDYIELAPLEEIEEPKLEKTTSTSSSAGRGEQGGGKPRQGASKDDQNQNSAEPILSEEELENIRNQNKADSIAEVQKKQKETAVTLIEGLDLGSMEGDETPEKESEPKPPGRPDGPHKDGIGEWNLDGRELIGGLPQPQCDFTQNAVVVVRIRVNPQGKVVEAEETAGTNISDRAMIQSAVEAAKRSKWNTSSQLNDQVGTIKYTFKIN